MWILFSMLCMVTMTLADIIGKKAVIEDELAPIKLRIMGIAVSFVLGMMMYFLHLGESGLAPWTLIANYPVILAVICCTVFSDFLYIFSLKYVGMTIMEAISSLEGIVIFVGMIIINSFSGRLGAIREMLTPARLIFILLILICTILLPNTELLANRNTVIDNGQKKGRKLIVFGILISLSAAILSCGDSLIMDTLLDADVVGTVDVTMAAFFSQIFLLPVFYFLLTQKSRQNKASRKVISRYSVAYALLGVVHMFMGTISISFDAVRSEIMFLTYPVISIFGAKIILKEKYTWRQSIFIWIITLAAICFCAIDYIS